MPLKNLVLKITGVMHGLTLNNGWFAILLYLMTNIDFLILGLKNFNHIKVVSIG